MTAAPSPAPSALAGRRVLLLNWRDRSHPRAGGAEVYVHEVARRLAAADVDTTVFTARHEGAAAEEVVDGVRVVRAGGTLGVYPRAALHLLARRRHYDAVLDFQNGIPFFAPLVASARTAVLLVVHHVHQEQFSLHYPWPVDRVGRWLEGPASRRAYGRRPVVAVSPSTRGDVRRRLGLRGPVHVVPNGLVPPAGPRVRTRAVEPRIAVVSRLVSHKRFDLLLDALPELRGRWPHLRVDVAGDGPERAALEARAQRLGLQGVVTFHGFVSAEQRQRLLRSAWLTASPSQAEGWGLTVIEANAEGLPAVAFDVPGLRDSVVDGTTGWLVPAGGALGPALHRALSALVDPSAALAWSDRCTAWASRFSWDASTERLAALAAVELDARRSGRTGRGGRRSGSDLSVRVEAPLDDAADVLPVLPAVLRRSDQWAVRSDRLTLLLHGCDDHDARAVVTRLGLGGSADVSLATTTDLLVGAR